MLTNRDVICLSSIDWDFIWQGHQEIMAAFAEQGNRVLFIENTGVRRPTFRDFPRLWHRLVSWWRSTKGFRRERDNLFVYSPLILPFPYSRLARRVNRMLLLGALQRWMHVTGFSRPIVWAFLPTPLTLDVIQELDPDLTVYYCIDDLASSSSAARRISRSESQLFRRADLVFVTSQKLLERARRWSERVHLFPFGVDFEIFERIRRESNGAPADLQALPRPIIGYIGGLHQWVDQSLLATVIARLPQASFVFIGPNQTDISQLTGFPNVRFLGARSHEEIPRYIKGFDVGIVPYRATDYTAHVYPTKLNEYLAMGIPVVATDLPEIRRFNDEHGEIVAVTTDAAEFTTAIQAACSPAASGDAPQRIAVARHNSWAERIAHMSALIEAELVLRQGQTKQGWQESLLRLYRVARRRVLTAIVTVGTAYLVLFHSSLLWYVAEPLRIVEAPRHADAIVVLGGGVGEAGKAGGGAEERVSRAIDLYQQGFASHIIFSSGYRFAFYETEIMKELAVAHHVPLSAILLETQARNTVDNATFVTRVLTQHEWQTILLVSSPYHMRRAVWTFRKHAPAIHVTATPVLWSHFYAHSYGASLDQIQGIANEYLSLLYYWLKGWV